MSKELAEQAISLINSTRSTITTDTLEVSELYDIASSRSNLSELHSIYCQIQPSASTVRRNPHWKNVKSAMEECATDPTLASKICSLFGNYLVDFGEKHILIDLMLGTDPEKQEELKVLEDLKVKELDIDKSSLVNLETGELTEGLRIVGVAKSASGYCLTLSETIATFSYEQLPKMFLTEAATLFAENVYIKKRKIVRGFHRVLFSKDNSQRIFLIDPLVLVRSETPVEKAFAVSQVIYATLGLKFPETGKRRSVHFFSSIKSLYGDSKEGVVTGGYFSTSAGSNFINSTSGRGVDLRKDPFQKGGEKAEPVSINFSKLTVEWLELDGGPAAILNGTSEMFERPKTSLPDFKTKFATTNGGSATHLQKVLEYATW